MPAIKEATKGHFKGWSKTHACYHLNSIPVKFPRSPYADLTAYHISPASSLSVGTVIHYLAEPASQLSLEMFSHLCPSKRLV